MKILNVYSHSFQTCMASLLFWEWYFEKCLCIFSSIQWKSMGSNVVWIPKFFKISFWNKVRSGLVNKWQCSFLGELYQLKTFIIEYYCWRVKWVLQHNNVIFTSVAYCRPSETNRNFKIVACSSFLHQQTISTRLWFFLLFLSWTFVFTQSEMFSSFY